jgi:hypothetical protein
VERWIKRKFRLYPAVLQRHATELDAFKGVVLKVLRKTTADEMPEIYRRTRPDLRYLWRDPGVCVTLQKEIKESIRAVEAL